MNRIRIGTCANPAEAAIVRAVFDAHDIRVLINAEQHASMLGGLGGAFVPLHIYVAEADGEQAAALLRDLNMNGPAADDLDTDGEVDADDDAEDDAPGASQVHSRIERRKRRGIVMLLALCVTFGTAHMYTGAWFRGIALAGAEILAFRYLVDGNRFGAALLCGCLLFDLVGALLRVRSAQVKLPEARIPS